MQLETSILQDICDQIAAEIDAVVTICGSRGKIIASSKRSRIGSFHERAAKIMAGEIDSVTVTAEDAAQSSTMLEGWTSAIDFGAGTGARAAAERVGAIERPSGPQRRFGWRFGDTGKPVAKHRRQLGTASCTTGRAGSKPTAIPLS